MPLRRGDQQKLHTGIVGALLAQLRRQHDWTQLQLAERIYFSQPRVSRIEAGQANPAPYEVQALAQAFGMTAATFTRLIEKAVARAADIEEYVRTGLGDDALAALCTLAAVSVLRRR